MRTSSTRPQKRGQRSGACISTVQASEAGAPVSAKVAGSGFRGTPKMTETSRATPYTFMAVDAVGGDVEIEHGIVAAHLDPVHGEAGRGQVVAQLADVGRRVHELAQPGDEDLHAGAHANCSRNRRSFS